VDNDAPTVASTVTYCGYCTCRTISPPCACKCHAGNVDYLRAALEFVRERRDEAHRISLDLRSQRDSERARAEKAEAALREWRERALRAEEQLRPRDTQTEPPPDALILARESGIWVPTVGKYSPLGGRFTYWLPMPPAPTPTEEKRAISIRQPYVELILRGIKKFEYRSIPTNIRETVYLYASRKPAENWDDYLKQVDGAAPGELPTGVIVGTVEITGCEWNENEGVYAYTLKNPQRLKRVLHPVNQPQPVFWKPKFK